MSLRRFPLFYFLTLLVFLLAGFDVRAYCGPTIAVPAGEKLGFSLLDLPNGFRFEAVLAEPLVLKANSAQLGLTPAKEPQKLLAPILINTDKEVPKLFSGLQPLAQGPLPARIQVTQGGASHAVQVNKDGLLDEDGRLLKLQPPTQGARIQVREGSLVKVEAGEITVEKGARLAWSPELKNPLELTLLQPARIPLGEKPANASRVEVKGEGRVAAGRKITLQLTQSGADFRSMEPQVCFSLVKVDGSQQQAMAIAQFVPDSITGTQASFTVTIPKELKSSTNQWPSMTFATPVTINVVGVDKAGTVLAFNAQTGFKISNAYTSLSASIVILALILMLAGLFLGTYRPSNIFIKLLEGRSGRFSLSNLQILMWTLLVLFSMSYVWINQGEMMTLTQGILALLGISGGTSVLSRFVPSTAGTAPATASTGTSDSTGSFRDMLRSEDGQFDLLRFQMLGFTVFTWLYALVSVIRADFFPEIPENLYYLMGLSSAAYLLGKSQSSGTTTNIRPDPNPAFTPSKEQLTQLQTKLGTPVTGILDAATTEAIKKVAAAKGFLPAQGVLTQALFDAIMKPTP